MKPLDLTSRPYTNPLHARDSYVDILKGFAMLGVVMKWKRLDAHGLDAKILWEKLSIKYSGMVCSERLQRNELLLAEACT